TKRDLRTAKVMKNQLSDIFTVTIESLPSSTFWDRENKKYDIAVTGAVPDISVDGPLYFFFRPKEKDDSTELSGGTFNDMWYFDKEVAELLAKQRTVLDPEKRKKILWKAEDKIMKEAPVAFTHHGIPFQATRSNVKGYVPHISQRDFSTVWLEN
ncbi:MAG: ABC transporter substrate-binding protein, partial [Halobacteriaceae archaeon]